MAFSLVQGSSQDLVACYNTAADCSDPSGDVTTTTPSAVWIESNVPLNAISLSLAAGKKRVTGNAAGTESFTAAYSGQTATMNATHLYRLVSRIVPPHRTSAKDSLDDAKVRQ
jgi:hypothetical protein